MRRVQRGEKVGAKSENGVKVGEKGEKGVKGCKVVQTV